MRKKSKPQRNKFKRKEIYGEKFRRQLNKKSAFFSVKYQFINELKMTMIKDKMITKQIKKLPEDLQKRLYIVRMRKYWKDTFMERPLKPMWCDYKRYMDNEIKKCYIKNIHFMHLECNTIPEMKKWIPGCQCDYCQNDKKVDNKDEIYWNIFNESNDYTFNKIIQCYDIIPNHWNTYMKYFYDIHTNNIIDQYKIFDCLKGYVKTIHDYIEEGPYISSVPLTFDESVLEPFNENIDIH